MTRASGVALLPGGVNHPLAATSARTGELIREAFDRRAPTVIVTMGGSATTDGGLGAVNGMGSIPRDAQLIVVCDVETRFKDAARDFGSQKGASPEQVAELSQWPEDLKAEYLDKPSSPPSGLHRHRTKSFLALRQCLQVCAIR